MNTALRFADFVSLGPLLIVLIGAVVVLLIETISDQFSKKWSGWIAALFLVLALVCEGFVKPSQHPLLTPWLRFDALAKFFSFLFLVIGLFSTLLAGAFFKHFNASRGEYFFLLLSATFGLMLIGMSADFLTLFLGIETLSISLYILCSYMKQWKISQESAIKYFLIGAMATSIFVYGIALIYGALGHTNFAQLASGYRGLNQSGTQMLFFSGMALVTVGLAFKAAVVPFHVWAPDVYCGAPTPVTGFMGVGTKAGAFAALAILFLLVLPGFNPLWNEIVSVLAILTLVYANFVALKQTQLRRFFAYSGISHAGYLLMPLVAGTQMAQPSLLFYLVIYSLATLGSFAVLAFIDQQSDGVLLPDLNGLFYRSPFLAVSFSLFLMTLAGVPPTAGFLAKFYVFKTAFVGGYYFLVIIALLTAILSAYYYLRIVALMFSQPAVDDRAPAHDWPAAIVAVLSVIGIVILSIYPEPFIQLLS